MKKGVERETQKRSLLKRRAPPVREAISPARIEALFAPLARAKGLLLAASGGPDSTALLLMAARWAEQPDRPPVAAATVDHAMREGSRAEAEAVGGLARRLGLVHHLIEWRGLKPRSRIQERAREARYRLLGACAERIGADVVVTAHHADDQAETVIFRLLRGSGIAGLRGMEEHRGARGALTLARPLLGLRKAELIAFCEACGEPFANDPSNEDPRFARTALRRLAGCSPPKAWASTKSGGCRAAAARMEDAVAAQARAAAERFGMERAPPRRAMAPRCSANRRDRPAPARRRDRPGRRQAPAANPPRGRRGPD